MRHDRRHRAAGDTDGLPGPDRAAQGRRHHRRQLGPPAMPAAATATSLPASISFSAQGLDQATPVKLYLYVFPNRDAWERHRDAIGPCAPNWVTDPQTYEELQESPYVLAGQGPWGPAFEAALRSTLAAAAPARAADGPSPRYPQVPTGRLRSRPVASGPDRLRGSRVPRGTGSILPRPHPTTPVP